MNQEAEFGPCYARMDETGLVVGNDCVERRWRIENGLLYPERYLQKAANRDWFAGGVWLPAPSPECNLPQEPRAVSFAAETGPRSPVQEPCLLVRVRSEGKGLTVTYAFQVFPGAPGIGMWVEHHGDIAPLYPAETTDPDRPALPTGVELADLSGTDEPFPALDTLERFTVASPHVRVTEVAFRDQTDRHNELVVEREWMMHRNEVPEPREGCLFVLEDPVTGQGLVFLKQAPLPHVRPVRRGPDARFNCRPRWQVGFHGHGAGTNGGAGYPWALLCFEGGRAGMTAALHAWQRRFRVYESGRDGTFLTNTWGDRSQDGRIREDFILGEVDAAARLGADVVQIDDGWEKGKTANSVKRTAIWQGYYAADPDFWTIDRERFPNGLEPVASATREQGVQFGLWFGPDSANDFANWERDADVLTAYHRQLGVNYFKLDGIKIHSKTGERNLNQMMDTVLERTDGRVVFDYDITAEVRQGYWGRVDTGPLFVENRYTDWHGYWPHTTLRNVWSLAHYVDPSRLRMEFLNNVRNDEQYADDPLAPSRYRADYLFATVMLTSPLGWFEVSNLPAGYVDALRPLVDTWKAHRERLHRGRVLPIGAKPDGVAWTGFLVLEGGGGYVLAFREANPANTSRFDVPARDETAVERLGGEGQAALRDGVLEVSVPEPLRFFFGRFGDAG